MTSAPDPRHLKRIEIVQQLFAASYTQSQRLIDEAQEIWDKKEKIDPYIAKTAPEWPLDKLNKIDLSILRLAVFELLFKGQEPVKVIVDEAVEVAKALGGESSPGFVNGVLGTIITEEKLAEKT